MSFVLDALKRSEQDRNQGQMPNLVDNGSLVHMSHPRRQWWPYVLIAVLLVNAAVFLYIAWPSEPPPQTAQRQGESDPLETVKEPARYEALPALGARQILAEESVPVVIEAPRNVSNEPIKSAGIDWAEREQKAKDLIAAHKAKERQVQTGQPVRIDPTSFDETGQSTASVADQYEVISPKKSTSRNALAFPFAEVPEQTKLPEVSASRYSDVKFLYELDARSRPSVPSLKFNSHIYSASPSARRVMINNIYLREGQAFMGLEVIEIGEFNVVFEKNGQLFKLPAMRDWNG